MQPRDPIVIASVYRLTGVNFQVSARALLSSIEAREDGTPAKATAIPFYYLASHAAELFLKSALLKRGFPEQQLRQHDYRHSLDSLMQELQQRGVLLSPTTTHLIELLHQQHKDHALRYTGLLDGIVMPNLRAVLEMLDELLSVTAISTQGR